MKYFATIDEFDKICDYQVKDIGYTSTGEITFVQEKPDELRYFLEGIDYIWELVNGINKQYRIPVISEEMEKQLKETYDEEDIQEIKWSPSREIPRKDTILLRKIIYIF